MLRRPARSVRRAAGALAAVALNIAGLDAAQAASSPDRTPSLPEYVFLVFSDPEPGREAEYQRWYDTEHAPDVVSIPGFESVQRFELAKVQMRPGMPPKPRFLALYTVATEDPKGVRGEIGRRARSGATRMSAAIAPGVQMFTYRALGPARFGAGADAPGARGPKALCEHLVFGDATTGQDQAFNLWYDSAHMPELLATPGFVKGQRAELAPVQLAPLAGDSRYLALFQIVTADLAGVFAAARPAHAPPPAFDRTRTFGYTYCALGPPILGAEMRARRFDPAPLSPPATPQRIP